MEKVRAHATRRNLVAVTLLLVIGLVAQPTPAAAATTKTLGGEIHCSGLGKVESIWFKGSGSGWHGKNVPSSERSYEMRYSFIAHTGETIQVWINCTNGPERYSEFKVGSGSTRHICDWGGLQVCTSTKLAGCVLKGVTGTRISLIGCIRYLR